MDSPKTAYERLEGVIGGRRERLVASYQGRFDMRHDDRLSAAVDRICREHGIPLVVGKRAFAALIKALDETQFKAHDNEGSLVNQTYYVLGDEAAYHLAGLLADHDEGIYLEELKYLDPSLKRFRSTIERWKAELDDELDEK